MTIRELMNLLSQLDGDMEVVVPTENNKYLYASNRVSLCGLTASEGKPTRLMIMNYDTILKKNINRMIDDHRFCPINRGKSLSPFIETCFTRK